MTHKVVFRPKAEADLFALYRYISESGGIMRADAYIGSAELAGKISHRD